MKNIIYSMKDLLKNYFNWHGRLSRASYLWSWAGILTVNVGLNFIRKAVTFCALFLYPYNKRLSEIMAYTILIWNIIIFFPILFATMRRYHDSGNAGWKALIFSVLSLVFIASGIFIGAAVVLVFMLGELATTAAALSAFLLLLGIGFCIVNMLYIFRQSDPQENKYGAPIPFIPAVEKTDRSV